MRLFLSVILLSIANLLNAQTYYSLGNSSFDDINNWDLNPAGGGGNPSSVTDGLSNFVIQNGHTITAAGSAIDINDFTIEVGGTYHQNANVDVDIQGNTSVSGTYQWSTDNTVTFHGALTVEATGVMEVIAAVSPRTHYMGDIINKGSFNISQSNFWYIDAPLSIQNQSTSDMNFSQNASGLGFINADLDILNFTGGGKIYMYSNTPIAVADNVTITNYLGDGTYPTEASLNLIALNATTGVTFKNASTGKIRYNSPTVSSNVTFDFADPGNEVFYVYGGDHQVVPTTYNNVYFSTGSGATLSLTGDIIVNNNLTIESNTILDAGSNNISVAGSWDNNNGTAGFIPGTSTVTFNASGVTSQNIFGSTNFYNLVINNTSSSGQVVMANDFTVSNQLTLTNGNIFLSANSTLYFLNSSSAVSGTFSNTRMIQMTDETSFVRKYFDAIGSFDFPIGTTGAYTPASISLTSGTTFGSAVGSRYVEVSVIDSEEPNVVTSGLSLTKYWTLSSANLSNISGTLNFTYDNSDVAGTESKYFSGFYNGTWAITAGVNAASNLNAYSFSGLTTLNGNYTAVELGALSNTFITTWVPSDTDIAVPHNPSYLASYNYNFLLTNISGTGGDTKSTGVSGGVTISGLTPGDTYELEISGNFPAIYFNGSASATELETVDQWGDIAWQSMNNAFNGCSNLSLSATDAPDLSAVTDMSAMFQSCSSLTGDFSGWDVSGVQNMSSMFTSATGFNGNITGWNVGNVTNMSSMFNQAQDFDQNIGSWNVTSVQNMQQMFQSTSTFNQDISSWNVSNVSNMFGMFQSATAFNNNGLPLDWTTTGSVSNMDVMFANATAFNQDVSSWDVSSVTSMSLMFSGATNFNQSLATWDISLVGNMFGMLDNTNLSSTNYDATLIGWNSLPSLQSGVNFGASGLIYCNSAASRANIVSTYSWTISGDTQNCPFITTWVPSDTDITIPTNPTFSGSYNYDYTLTNISGTGGDSNSTGESGSVTITGLNPGDTYQLEITGNFPAIYFNNNTTIATEIVSIEQWGDIAWQSMNSAFYGCSNLIYNATDIPDLTATTDMSYMFTYCSAFDGSIGGWNTSTITNMSHMFQNATAFNQNIGNWITSSVQDMTYMFSGATNFNQDISFKSGGGNFGGDAWNTSNVTDMSWMFYGASVFDADISGWNTSQVNTMQGMFYQASDFNQNLGEWNTSSVTDMQIMFAEASMFNQDISGWNTSLVTTMASMFFNATVFNQSLGNWDVSGVAAMNNMLSNTALSSDNYDATLIGWESLSSLQSSVTLGATGLTYCSGATARTNLISNNSWTISGDALNCAFITTWITSDNQITIPTTGTGYNYNVVWTNLTNTGVGDGSISNQTANCTISGLENGSTYQVEISGSFPQIYFNNLGDKDKLLSIEQWGDNSWISMSRAFYGCSNLVVNAVDAPDLSLVTDMSLMFQNASSLNQDISNWDVSTITNMSNLFYGASSFNQDISPWVVDNVQLMGGMFAFSGFNRNISVWNTIAVTNMAGMFRDSPFNQNIGSWDVSSVTSMNRMFQNAPFNQDIGGWDVSSVLDFTNMFRSTPFNQDIGGWDVSAATSMANMFVNNLSFNQNLGLWDIGNVTNMSGMFANNDMSVANYDATIIGWLDNNGGTEIIPTGITLGAQGINYCNAETERQTLIDSFGWTFDDAGALCDPEINVYQGEEVSGTLLIDAVSVFDIGPECISEGTSLCFDTPDVLTIENVGTTALTISDLSWQTGGIFQFSGPITLPEVVLPGQVVYYFITNDSGINGLGIFTDQLSIISDDADEGTFTFDVTVNIVNNYVIEMDVYEGLDNTGSPITNNQATPINFGNTNESLGLSQTFTIENTGNSLLEIYDISVNDSHFTVTPVLSGALGINDGAPENFTIDFTPTVQGTFNATVTIANNNTETSPYQFDVVATVDPSLEPQEIDLYLGSDNRGTPIVSAQPTAIDFGSTPLNTDVPLTFAIENTGLIDLSISSISVTGSVFSITNPPTSVGFRSIENFDIVLSGANAGTFSETVTITSNDADEGTYTFSVIGTITGTSNNQDIQITFGGSPLISGASTIDFGSTDVGTNVTQTVIIENTGTDDLVITNIQLADGTVFTLPALIFPITLAPGETLNLSLILDASSAGLFEDQLIITSNDLDEGSFEIGLSGEVVGNTSVNIVDITTNQVIITGQDVNLGQTNINVSIDKNFGIENLSSTEVLQILSITVDNLVFEIINAPTSIDPNGRVEFTIRLQTNAIGIHTGIVTVTTNINNFSFGVIGEVVSDGNPPLTIYNIVTPNGDGIHDFFKIVNIESYPSSSVSIFDRWGGKVFETSNYNNTSNFFNGIANGGDELITGNYYYVIDKGNGDKPERGFIFLKR